MEHVGGQAVVEGVMMQSGKKIAVAARRPDGKIVSKSRKFRSLAKKRPWNLPVLRGSIALFEMLVIGIKVINWSASVSVGEDETPLSLWQRPMTVVMAIAFALLLFKLAPLGIVQLLSSMPLFGNRYIFNLVEGLLKVLLITMYIWLIGFMPDVKSLFMYHGAEHKAVNCYEAKKKLTAKNCKQFSTVHKRCGTSFILLVLFISILVYVFIPMDISFMAKYGLRILLLPLVAGLAYEVLKLNAKHENLFLKAFVKPGLWLQKLTTREPDKKQLEVAFVALKKCIKD